MTVSVPQIPNEIAAGAQVTFTQDVAKSTSEGGNSNRKEMRKIIRNYTVTISPEYSDEMQAIIESTSVARYPVAIMDPLLFSIVNEPAVIQPGGATAKIVKTFQPSTGTVSRQKRILLPVPATLSVLINGVAATSGAATLADYGILNLSPTLDPDTDLVEVTCQFYTPCCGLDAPSATAFGRVGSAVQYQFTSMRFEEIFEAEFVELTS
ncbi:hypothetical protein [Bradyrhizobium sp. CCBAU 51753]|uniref:hypothetical protein n=1 Tax=Bradyrhizobium sp. CCBAU 51753 TaxID=1325100 RepID=UPI00188B9E15|nr:hypothetical protein [Bradyrhizobium sp. CCBAU 51753]QOZ25272.1 hypothetical protein XH93_18010 [Bradyrhizobium sp. CCBAU 51753]